MPGCSLLVGVSDLEDHGVVAGPSRYLESDGQGARVESAVHRSHCIVRFKASYYSVRAASLVST